MTNKTVFFSKFKPEAKIPSKIDENAGYDIYACFDEDYIILYPHETKLIPTGIASAFSDEYVFVLKERGSTGSKGIGQRCGIIDSGYRGEWFVGLTNHNDVPMCISKLSAYETRKDVFADYEAIVYPYSKAICQALLLPVPKVNIEELSYDDLLAVKSNRGTGKIGSSGK